jgi:tuberculosinol/isotuberculosinol synthase
MIEATNDAASWSYFRDMPKSEVAALLSAGRRRSVVLAVTGPQRWFILGKKTAVVPQETYWEEYRQAAGEQYVTLLRLLFEHGIHTVFLPLLVSKTRGRVYLEQVLRYLPQVLVGQEFQELYEDLQVQVRFYGPYRSVLESLGFGETCQRMFTEVMHDNSDDSKRRVFWGLITPDADPDMEIAGCAVEHYRRMGSMPSREQLLEALYGEQVEPIDFLITGGKFQVLTYLPPLLRGQEDLYFTVNSPLGLTQSQLRAILFDNYYCRRHVAGNRPYQRFSPRTLADMKALYDLNRESVVGVGRYHPEGQFWYPIPQVRLPETLVREERDP